jgi:hypothetical protein
MKTILSIAMFLVVFTKISGQDVSLNSTLKKIRKINSTTERTDDNKKLSKKSPNGTDPELGSFSFTFYYIPNKEVRKIECRFTNDTSAIKIFYYLNNDLIKIIDGETQYYFIDTSFVNNRGLATDTVDLNNLVKFQEGLKHDIITFMLK